MPRKMTDYLTQEEIDKKINRVELKSAKVTIQEGDYLPENITLPSTSGALINLFKEAQDSNIVLFFYPGYKMGLEYPELIGCTAEACSFKDNISEFENLNCKIFGVNLQSTDCQQVFKKEQGLSFEILSDEKEILTQTLGLPIWKVKGSEQNAAKENKFSSRSTVVIRHGGLLSKIIYDVKLEDIDNHVSEVLDEIKKSCFVNYSF